MLVYSFTIDSDAYFECLSVTQVHDRMWFDIFKHDCTIITDKPMQLMIFVSIGLWWLESDDDLSKQVMWSPAPSSKGSLWSQERRSEGLSLCSNYWKEIQCLCSCRHTVCIDLRASSEKDRRWLMTGSVCFTSFPFPITFNQFYVTPVFADVWTRAIKAVKTHL